MVWTIFKHYLLSRRSSALIRSIAWLCISGVSVGVIAMIVVLSVMNGFDGAIRQRLLAVEPHLVVKLPDATSPLADQVMEQLKSQPGVMAHSYESQDVVIRTVDGLYGGGVARGVDRASLTRMLREVYRAQKHDRERGEDILVGTEQPLTELEAGEISLGVDLAHSLGIFEGDEVVLAAPEGLLLPAGEIPAFERVKVKHILRTNVPDLDSQVVFYSREEGLKRLQKIQSGKESGIEIRFPDPENFEEAKRKIESLGLTAETWQQRNSALFHSLRMEKMAIGLFLGLSILIASFSIMTVLVLLVTQKRKDIGILMAMGLSPVQARRLFAGVGMLLSGVGLLGGIGVGLLLCLMLDRFPIFTLPDVYYDTRIPVDVDPIVVTFTILGSLVISLLASWIPALLATRMTPTAAIRFEPE